LHFEAQKAKKVMDLSKCDTIFPSMLSNDFAALSNDFARFRQEVEGRLTSLEEQIRGVESNLTEKMQGMESRMKDGFDRVNGQVQRLSDQASEDRAEGANDHQILMEVCNVLLGIRSSLASLRPPELVDDRQGSAE
jgi:hypothetical protein